MTTSLPAHPRSRTGPRWYCFSLLSLVVGGAPAGCRSEAAGAPQRAPLPSDSVKRLKGPSFRVDVLPTIERNCSDAKGCHGFDRTDSVDLDLSRAAAYRELVGHESEVRKGALRIAPGDPEHSFVLDKLSGRLGHDEGKRMPLDEVTGAPIEPSPISSAFVADTLIPWIRNGAKDE